MNNMTFLAALALTCLFSLTQAVIPSFGSMTNGAIRDKLADSDFKINPNNGIQINNPDFRVAIANLQDFPVLSGQDVQIQIVRVTVKAGKPFIPHFHPRGTEVLNALSGTFKIVLTFDGLNPRKVVNIIKAGESTVFPVGLVHETTCVSKQDCTFLSVLNSADPGLTPVTV